MTGWKKGYYYLHISGQIIWLPINFDTSNFINNTLVVEYWKVLSKRDYNRMKMEAKQIEGGYIDAIHRTEK